MVYQKPWQRFILTTGEIVTVAAVTADGESFDWLGQSSYREQDMEDVDGDSLTIRCLTPRADETARMVDRLYDAQDGESRAYQEAVWAAFCAAKSDDDFRKLLAAIPDMDDDEQN